MSATDRAALFSWLVNNVLNESQLSMVPPGERRALRFLADRPKDSPIPPPADMAGAEAQGWRGFHSGTGLTTDGAPPGAWRGREATLFLRGWWLAYARHYGAGAAAFARYDESPAVDEPQNPWPEFSAPWEAWAAGFEAAAE